MINWAPSGFLVVFVPEGSLVRLWVVSVRGDVGIVAGGGPGWYALYRKGVRKRGVRVEGVVYAGNDISFLIVKVAW